jgi:SPP1 gp7 family putative phage head morphogenesis protein
MRRRFKLISSLIVKTVVQNDALSLGSGPAPLGFQIGPATRSTFAGFTTDASKADAFMTWLNGAVDSEVLEIFAMEGRTVVEHGAWQETYVRSGYRSGVLNANQKLAKAGVGVSPTDLFDVFNSPRHADSLGLLYTRNFNELKGISDAMSQSIARVLAGGMAEGIGPREMARLMVGEVNISINRATVLARTEIIRAHAEATLNRYADFGIPGVTAMVEFQTAGDDRVCPDCESLESAGQFTLDEARGIIPVHPQCRCTWVPVVDEPERFKKLFGFVQKEPVAV